MSRSSIIPLAIFIQLINFYCVLYDNFSVKRMVARIQTGSDKLRGPDFLSPNFLVQIIRTKKIRRYASDKPNDLF